MPSDKLLLFHKQCRTQTSADMSASEAQPVSAIATESSSARISNNLSLQLCIHVVTYRAGEEEGTLSASCGGRSGPG